MPPKSQATNKKRRAVDDDAYGGRPSTKQRPPATKAGKMVPKPQQVKLTAPKIPPNAATINKENRLDMALDNLPKRFSRPWYFYDAVDPVPKFRHLGAAAFAQRKHQPDVSEGEKSEELSDHPGDDTLPVFVFGYRYVPRCHPTTSRANCIQAKILRDAPRSEEGSGNPLRLWRG